ncbi:MAG: pyruvate kinase [Elusimicrobia bacterium CG08_land_8_20_14_0_20_51_18]|nr:MAG: pyruvate kinase [Elusimicrobia bacterium CG08_land_8_20_14_0_20_51_18]
MPKTKIIATIGPASADPVTLRKMFIFGLDAVRFNFSHGSCPEYLKNLRTVRTLNKKMRRRIKTIADLKGNRIRIRNVEKEFLLPRKQLLTLTRKNVKSDPKTISFDYKGSLKPVKKGHKIYIDDGKLELEVFSVSKDSIKTIVRIGGPVKNRKGVNMPMTPLAFPVLNAQDREDLVFAAENGFDYVAQSFVRNAEDLKAVRKILKEKGSEALVIAKIENREALKNLDEILKLSDGIMVARGDLGISVPIWEIPVLQKDLVRKAGAKKKFSIVATQMLESMTENHLPTRAEATDVANAIFDGANYVMLSAETASGKYPVECVRIMNEIVKYTERHLRCRRCRE